MKKIIIILSFFIFASANAGMSDNDKSKAWDCVGIYMANYFLPSGEKFEYGMKEKSISTVKVLKTYALEIGIPEKDWDAGVNKAVDKHYGSKYDKAKTDKCHTFVEALVPNGAERVKKSNPNIILIKRSKNEKNNNNFNIYNYFYGGFC